MTEMTDLPEPRHPAHVAHACKVFSGRMSHRNDARELFAEAAETIDRLRKERDKLKARVNALANTVAALGGQPDLVNGSKP